MTERAADTAERLTPRNWFMYLGQKMWTVWKICWVRKRISHGVQINFTGPWHCEHTTTDTVYSLCECVCVCLECANAHLAVWRCNYLEIKSGSATLNSQFINELWWLMTCNHVLSIKCPRVHLLACNDIQLHIFGPSFAEELKYLWILFMSDVKMEHKVEWWTVTVSAVMLRLYRTVNPQRQSIGFTKVYVPTLTDGHELG